MSTDAADLNNNGAHKESSFREYDANNDSGAAQFQVDNKKKKEFERKRAEILSCVPDGTKARFGEIHFCKFGGYTGPVLVMDPYRVEPGPLRNSWITMYQTVSGSNVIR